MKRNLILLVVLLFTVATLFCACAPKEEQQVEEPPEAVATTEAPSQPEGEPVALVMAGQEQFNETFVQAVQPQIEAAGYRVLTYYSQSAEAQIDDVYTAIGAGAKCIVLQPVDMDNLQQVLDETDLQDIPIVNIMVPINGVVQTLISPDYSELGRMAAQAASQSQADGANMLMVENLQSTFITQMKRDGFQAEAGELNNVSFVSSILIGDDLEQIKDKTAQALSSAQEINTIFIMEEYFLDGVLAAAAESGRDIAVIAVGGGSAVMDAIESGAVYASVFASPTELAQIAGDYAVRLAQDSKASVLEYEGLKLETITAENVQSYRQTGSYANILTPVAPSPSPQPSEKVPPEDENADGQEEAEQGEQPTNKPEEEETGT